MCVAQSGEAGLYVSGMTTGPFLPMGAFERFGVSTRLAK
jgi:hypothetical protein